MSRDVQLWKKVVGDTRLLERAAAVDAGDVAAVASLRKAYPADAVAVALELTAARAKAATKFSERARDLVADVPGVEQASGAGVAAYKAQRMREALGAGARVVDACCGIGGDSMALAQAGLGVTAVDRDPLRAWMAGRNGWGADAIDAVCADVAELTLSGVALHIDPARREEAAGRRAWRLDDYRPGPAVIAGLIAAASTAAVKLSPGVDVDALDEALPPGEVEFISERGRLVQAVLWTGGFHTAERRATLLADDKAHTLAGASTSMPIGEAGRYVFAIDPSVERAGLLGRLCEHVGAPMLHPSLGLLTADHPIDSPWLIGFELIERLPWRPKRVKQWLARHDGGLVEVKTRGKACDPDQEQHRLRGKGATTYTVFVLRFGTKVQALICRRLMNA